VCHLADSETAAAMYFRQVIAEQDPALAGYDQEAWAAKLGYENRKISQALEMFRLLRSANYELLKDQPEEVFRRAGNHAQFGRVTLLQLLRTFAEHAESHVKQIHSVRAAFKEHKAKQAAQ
jgi:hypothetical protein